MIRHLLVTGGAGFIGSHFTRHAMRVSPDTVVTVLDALTYAGDRARLPDTPADAQLRFVHGDICDAPLLASLLSARDGAPAVDAVAHFAAETHVDRSIADPIPFVRTNITGTYTLLEVIRALGAAGPRLLHVSTDEVYGDLRPGEAPFTEVSPLAPSSPYAATKAAADGLVFAWIRTYGVRATITRGGNNYGTRQYPEKLIPVALAHALAGEPIPLYGDGMQRREWVHVDDHADALWTVLNAERPRFSVYNVPGEPDVANRTVAEIILDSLGLPRSLIASVADRPGHDRRYALDGSRLRDEFGWQPKRMMREALPSIVAFERDRLASRPIQPGQSAG
jgi:dTDP-glucose 4,6-dehydratase